MATINIQKNGVALGAMDTLDVVGAALQPTFAGTVGTITSSEPYTTTHCR